MFGGGKAIRVPTILKTEKVASLSSARCWAFISSSFRSDFQWSGAPSLIKQRLAHKKCFRLRSYSPQVGVFRICRCVGSRFRWGGLSSLASLERFLELFHFPQDTNLSDSLAHKRFLNPCSLTSRMYEIVLAKGELLQVVLYRFFSAWLGPHL